jgi:hypothetical protein
MLNVADKDDITKTDELTEVETGLKIETNAEDENGEDNKGETGEDEEGSQVVVSIGEESPASEESSGPAPAWVKELRKNHRELQKRNRELEEQVKAVTGAEQKPATLGKKPTLEECDYDTDAYERNLESWHERKREVEAEERAQKAKAEEASKAWQDVLNAYSTSKSELKVKDFEDAEDVAKAELSVMQQGIVLQGSKNAALLIYALGKNPKRMKEIASISDPVKFAFAVAGLENQLKVTNRKTAPAAEKTVRGNAAVSGIVDSQLERLREEAASTGNYTKVNAYKAQLRDKKK